MHRHVVKALCSYDLVGFQTRGDLLCFHDYIRREDGGEVARDGTVKAFGRIFKAAAFPIGIDTEIFAQMAAESDGSKQFNRLEESHSGRALIIDEDRLDYYRGLKKRINASKQRLTKKPEKREK